MIYMLLNRLKSILLFSFERTIQNENYFSRRIYIINIKKLEKNDNIFIKKSLIISKSTSKNLKKAFSKTTKIKISKKSIMYIM